MATSALLLHRADPPGAPWWRRAVVYQVYPRSFADSDGDRVVDLVPNHTSDAHEWFRAALAAPAGSPERARYVFRDGTGPGGAQPPNDWHSVFGGAAWTRVTEPDGTPGQWYLHLFDVRQPDLN